MKNTERIGWAGIVILLAVWGLTRSGVSGTAENGDSSVRLPTKATRSSLPSKIDSTREDLDEGRNGTQRAGLESRARSALRSSDRLERLSGFLKVLAACGPDNLAQVQEALNELKASGISLPVEEELINFRAGQLKGAELLADHTGTSSDFAILGTLKKQYEGWAQEDPQSAGRWLEDLPAGKYRDQMAVIFIAANAMNDPEGSLRWVSSLHPSQQVAAGKTVAGRLTETATLEEATAFFDTWETNGDNGTSAYLETVFSTIVSGLAKADGAKALSLIESHIDQPFVSGSILARVSEEKAKSDPIAALQWAATMEGRKDDIVQGGIMDAAIQGMTQQGLADAESWIADQGDLTADHTIIQSMEQRKRLLEDRGDDHNDYDKGD